MAKIKVPPIHKIGKAHKSFSDDSYFEEMKDAAQPKAIK